MRRHISTYPSPPAVEVIRQPEVVIIDDDAELTRAIARVLRNKYNCRVWGFSSVEEFLAAVDGTLTVPLRQDDLDLILLDFHLPGRNGPKLVEELKHRSSGLLHRSRIMGLTADGQAQVVNSFKDVGIDEILKKPLKKLDFGHIAEQAYKICSGEDSAKESKSRIIKTYI
jgi:FixJ family two-component response regulator